MKIAFLLFLLLPLASQAQKDLKQENREKVARILLKNGGLMRGSCVDFVETQLSQLKLPAIGEKSSPPGRGGFDRAGIKDNPPIMKDSITVTEKGETLTSTLKTSEPDKKSWELRLNRNLKIGKREVIADTIFHFKRQPGQNLCRMDGMSYFVYEKGKAAPSKTLPLVSVNDCLDLFLKESVEDIPGEPVVKALNWLKDDCSLLIRFSPETQKMAEPASSK